MDLEQLQKIGNCIIDRYIHSDWLPCMFYVHMSNTKIDLVDDMEMDEDGNDSEAIYGTDTKLNIEE